MSAPGKVWRVEPGRFGVGWDIWEDGNISRLACLQHEEHARAVVEAHNAKGEAEPVGWTWPREAIRHALQEFHPRSNQDELEHVLTKIGILSAPDVVLKDCP